MIEEAKELYASLEASIAACNNHPGTPLEIIECCFQAANQYWSLMKNRLNGYVFPSQEEEIFFFRHIKPLFTSAIEYYGLLAHAQLFKDHVADEVECGRFLDRELKRLDKLTQTNHAFFEYYTTGATANDTLWFVRANNDGGNFVHAKPYDLDGESTTRYDYLISSFLALEKYGVYLRGIYPVIKKENQ